jgi:hypothetical protein
MTGLRRTKYFTYIRVRVSKRSKRAVRFPCLSNGLQGLRAEALPTTREDYDIVRYHHPDSPHNQTQPPSLRRARFQALSAAYDVLRGKTGAREHANTSELMRAELNRRRRAQMRYAHGSEYERARQRHRDGGVYGDGDAWKDTIIVGVGIAVSLLLCVIFLASDARKVSGTGAHQSHALHVLAKFRAWTR